MPPVVDHLAELTGFRDRDRLDATLVGALMSMLQSDGVAIYRSVADARSERWLTRARLRAGELAPSADPLWADFETLPLLGSCSARHACLQSGEPVAVAGPPALDCFPLCSSAGSALGVLEIDGAAPLDDDQRRLVTGVLRVYRNFHELLDDSEHDSLTGLLNRKTFDESFLRSAVQHDSADSGLPPHRRAPAGGTASSWLGVIDIDHFKRVNDDFGHLIGDEVLLLLSRLMRGTFRFHDQLYRFGGEEFVVLMRCGDADAAAVAFERLRATVAAHAFPRAGHITVSIGFTAVRDGDTPSGAFERADKAVYYVKQHGRNQVANHTALVASGALDDALRLSDVELF